MTRRVLAIAAASLALGWATLATAFAGWLVDPGSGCRLWVAPALEAAPHRLQWAGDCIARRADGYGRARILARDGGPAPLVLTGIFRDGVYLGETAYANDVTPLGQGDALIDLGNGGVLGQRIWIHRRFVDSVRVPLCGPPEGVLVALPAHFSSRDESGVKRSLLQAAAAYGKLCPEERRLTLMALPADHRRTAGAEVTAFEPMLATAEVAASSPGEWTIAAYRNDAAREDERRRREEQARQPPRQSYEEYAAETKGRFDAFTAETNAVSWVKVEQIDANPFRWEGTVVAFRGEVRRMLTDSTALVGGADGTAVVLRGVPTDLLLEPATIVAAARIRARQPLRLIDGQGNARQVALVQAELVAARPCAAKACMDFFEWIGHDFERFPWGGDPSTFTPRR